MKEKPEIVQQILDIIGADFSRKLSIESIAQRLHYSASGLRKLFHKATGESIKNNLLRIRIEKAKKLLSETRLPAREIGYEAGFSSPEHFTRLFRRRTGLSPMQYRKQFGAVVVDNSILTNPGKPYFQDTFRGNRLSAAWKPMGESWALENGTAVGTTQDSAVLFLRKALPENFEASFDVRFSPGTTDLTISLSDKENLKQCWQIRLASKWAPLSELHRRWIPVQWNARSAMDEDRWYSVRFLLREDILCLWVDGEVIFHYVDPFPPVYTQRCALAIGVWFGQIKFRNFVIRDLGFSLFIRSIRQADALYNEGFYSAARERYLRQLQSENSSSEWMELRCKIGMTLLAQRKYDQAREWMEKVITLPETDLWARHAKIGLLEIECRQSNTEIFCRMLGKMFQSPVLRDMVRSVANQAILRLRWEGFLLRAANICKALTAEEGDEFLRFRGLITLCDLYFRLNRFREVEKTALWILASPRKPAKEFHSAARITLVDTYIHLGRFRKAEYEMEKADLRETATRRCHLQVLKATSLRARGRYHDALSLFATAPELFPSARVMGAFSLLMGSLLLSALDRTDEARTWIERARKFCPESPHLNDGRKSRIFSVPYLMEGQFENAAEMLLEDTKVRDDAYHIHADQYARAGLLLELAGRNGAARRVWAQCIRQYPPFRCNFYPQLVKELAQGRTDCVSAMPYPARDRAEMFYLVALLSRKRKQYARARDLFRLCAGADPTRNWASIAARKELGQESFGAD